MKLFVGFEPCWDYSKVGRIIGWSLSNDIQVLPIIKFDNTYCTPLWETSKWPSHTTHEIAKNAVISLPYTLQPSLTTGTNFVNILLHGQLFLQQLF